MSDYMSRIPDALDALDAGHQAFHGMPDPGPDDPTALVALFERDLLLIGMALPALEILFFEALRIDCFREASVDLQKRLMEVVDVQRPEWTRRGREEVNE